MGSTTARGCVRENCQDCPVQGRLRCLHRLRDYLFFLVLFAAWAAPFLAGMTAGRHWTGLLVWLGLALIFFLYFEALILCRHCPHYLEAGASLRCHANYGLPKIPRFDPRPLRRWEQVLWLIWVAVLFLFHLPFFILDQQWPLLALTTGNLAVIWWIMRLTMCQRCYNLSCPLNRTPGKVREVFFRNYPDFARAWGKAKDESEG